MRSTSTGWLLSIWALSACGHGDTHGTLATGGSAGQSAGGSNTTGGTGGGPVVASGGSGGRGSGGTNSGSGGEGAGGKPTAENGAAGASTGTGGAVASPDAGAIGIRSVPAPPTYKGTLNDAAGCTEDYATRGFEPDDQRARHPLFLYFTGTNFTSDAATFRDQSEPAVTAVTKAMARRGFVALWVEYDNGAIPWLSDHVEQLKCLFDTDATSILAVACALPNVDCDQGIATWGHSQGAYVANRAYGFDPRVRAAWLAGYGGDAQSTMPTNRLRVENGENDTTNGQETTVDQVTGLTPADCPDNGTSSCFRPDGSGWAIVRAKDCVTSTADHCWFDKKTCLDSQVTLEQNWIDPNSTKPFALERNADWVAMTTRRP